MNEEPHDQNYWKGILETVSLMRRLNTYFSEKQDQTEFRAYLKQIRQKAELKAGQASQLSDELGLTDKLGLARTPIYWKAVSDTVNLVREFEKWKAKNPQSEADLESVLDDVYEKAEVKLDVVKSPLMASLDISFDKIHKQEQPAHDITAELRQERDIPKEVSYEKEKPVYVEPELYPKPDLESIPDPILEPTIEPEKPTYVEPDYSSEPVSQPVMEKPTYIDPKPEVQPELPAPVVDESSLASELLGDSEDEDELLSSSLRDALRMLREDDEE